MNAFFRSLKQKGTIGVACIACAALLVFIQPLFEGETLRFIVGCLFQLLVLAPLAGLLYFAGRRWLSELGYSKKEMIRVLVFTLAFAVIGLAFLYFFFRGEKDIKVYDQAFYWMRVIEDRGTIGDSILRYLTEVWESLSQDYNAIAAFPLLLISYITGIQFTGYVQAGLLVYYVPACFFLSVFAMRLNKLGSERKPGSWMFAFCFAIGAICVGFMWPLLNGYLDISGVLIMALLLNVTLTWDVFTWDWRQNTKVALLSVAMVLLRRWYFYYIIGFFVSIIVVSIVRLLLRREFTWQKLGRFVLNLLMIVALGGFILYCLNPAIFRLLTGGNAAEQFGAYDRAGFLSNLARFARNIGYIWLALAVAGMVLLIRRRGTRAITFQLLLTTLIAAWTFSGVQNMNEYHYYLLLPTLVVMLCGLGEFAVEYYMRHEKPILVISILLICGISFPLSFYQPLGQYSWISEPITTSMHHYPVRRPYYETARLVTSDLKQIAGDDSTYMYVVGDGPLNAEVLRRAYLPDEVNAAPFLFQQKVVDQRDGFPHQAFFSDYLLINKPYRSDFLQVQQVNFQLYDLIENDPLAAEYYAVDSVYPTDTGEAILYRKKQPTDTTIVNALRDRLEAYYPDNAFVYGPNYFLTLFDGDDGTHFTFNQWSNIVSMEKEAGEPVGFRLNDTKDFTKLSFNVASPEPGLVFTIEDQTGELDRIPVEIWGPGYTFDITGSEYIAVTVLEEDEKTPVAGKVEIIAYHDSLL